MIYLVPQLPRFHAAEQRAEDARKIAEILLELVEEAPPKRVSGARSGGDERALRGLPAVGRGIAGAMPGTSPHHAVIANEMRVSKKGVRRPR